MSKGQRKDRAEALQISLGRVFLMFEVDRRKHKGIMGNGGCHQMAKWNGGDVSWYKSQMLLPLVPMIKHLLLTPASQDQGQRVVKSGGTDL